jgi:hypothetical protein
VGVHYVRHGELSHDVIVSHWERHWSRLVFSLYVGRRVLKVPFASNIAGVRDVVRRIAEAVGEADVGNAVIAKLDQRLAAVAATTPGGTAPTAVIYQVNGIASAAGTLED